MNNTDNIQKMIDLAEAKKNNFNLMASVHFKLSDIYKCYASWEDAIEVFFSVALCGITFFDFNKYFNFEIFHSSLVIGAISISLFAFTLIKQKLDHKKLSEQHQLAGKQYSYAKLDISTKIIKWKIDSSVTAAIILQYIEDHYSHLNDMPQIPEKYFLKLKHHHQHKVEMSKFLDIHRNECWLLCKLKFLFTNESSNSKNQ